MLKKIILLMISSVISLPLWSQSNEEIQRDAYNRIIPSHQKIVISHLEKRETQTNYEHKIILTINRDYSVSLFAYITNSRTGYMYENGSYQASGTVVWNEYSKKMIIRLDGMANADFTWGEAASVNKDIKGREFKGSKRVYQTLTLHYDSSSNSFYVTGFSPCKVTIGNVGKGYVIIPVELIDKVPAELY